MCFCRTTPTPWPCNLCREFARRVRGIIRLRGSRIRCAGFASIRIPLPLPRFAPSWKRMPTKRARGSGIRFDAKHAHLIRERRSRIIPRTLLANSRHKLQGQGVGVVRQKHVADYLGIAWNINRSRRTPVRTGDVQSLTDGISASRSGQQQTVARNVEAGYEILEDL